MSSSNRPLKRAASPSSSSSSAPPTKRSSTIPSLASWLSLQPPARPAHLYHSQPLTDRASTFIAHAAPCSHPSQASHLQSYVRTLVSPQHPESADHEILGWRTVALKPGRTGEAEDDWMERSGGDDDGEKNGGNTVRSCLKELGAVDVAVVVSRWYGGIMLGPDRFTHMRTVATQAVSLLLTALELPPLIARLEQLDGEVDELLEAEGKGGTGKKQDYAKVKDKEVAKRLVKAREMRLSKMTKTLPFGNETVPVPGFGAMSFAGAYGAADDSKAQDVLKKALDEGCTFWDTAVVYGFGSNEQLIGDFFRANPGSREKVFIASKCGRQLDFENKIRIKVDNSPAHIAEYIEGTISRLGSPPDLYYLHRIEPGFPLELSIAALAKLKEEGKTRYIGLSECSAETLRKACAIAHIDALQIEYSPWSIEHEENGLIDTARELGVAVVAFGPLGSGILTGKYRSAEDFAETDFRRFIPRFSPENFPKNLKIVDAFIALAAKKGCTPGQLSIAWVIAQGFIPIPGTKDEGRLLENWGAGGVELTEDELREIRRLVIEARPVGDRFPPAVRAEAGH